MSPIRLENAKESQKSKSMAQEIVVSCKSNFSENLAHTQQVRPKSRCQHSALMLPDKLLKDFL